VRIGGLQKQTLIDFPGKIACVVFLSGCNFACPYCHNPQLATGQARDETFADLPRFCRFLEERNRFLEGVVVSGGEPTVHEDLPELCAEIKRRGCRVKLDTNGSRPDMIRRLMDAGLVDYIAMDIKTDPQRYPVTAGLGVAADGILESIGLIMAGAPDYEFRTTCVRPFVNDTVIAAISRCVQGAARYVLQRFQHRNLLSPAFFQQTDPALSDSDIHRFQTIAAPWVQSCLVR
jgi:pyruvate formate lyase activating enzyme